MFHLLLPLLAVNGPVYLLYAVPLIIAVSLVYAATRHEEMGAILHHAFRVGVWIIGFMLVVFAVLMFVWWWG